MDVCDGLSAIWGQRPPLSRSPGWEFEAGNAWSRPCHASRAEPPRLLEPFGVAALGQRRSGRCLFSPGRPPAMVGSARTPLSRTPCRGRT